ncbi:unnamed protein product [Soboliphyme baturini]|uniref:Secreted protein n=1 Tax=Soboliphyme baturini TaxID=241478 RepID=A0A183J2T0_9BILA|nr:unnamed protein product [Soboliphyme baturini]
MVMVVAFASSLRLSSGVSEVFSLEIGRMTPLPVFGSAPGFSAQTERPSFKPSALSSRPPLCTLSSLCDGGRFFCPANK